MSEIEKVKRKIVREDLNKSIVYDVYNYDIDINEIITDLLKFKLEGATHIDFTAELAYEENTLEELELQPIRQYLESEEEALERFKRQKKQAEEINNRKVANDKRELKRLKAIYE